MYLIGIRGYQLNLLLMTAKDLAAAANQDQEDDFAALERDTKYNPKREDGEETTEGVEEALQTFLARSSD